MVDNSDETIILGWKERISLADWGLTLKALVDPTSPLSTLAVEHVERMGRMRDEEGHRRLVLLWGAVLSVVAVVVVLQRVR